MNDLIVTPDPYYINGYTGHVPGYRYRCGGVYGRISHKLFMNPCTSHSPNIVLTHLGRLQGPIPDPKKLKILEEREKTVDAIYKYPLIVGYDGHVPGKNFLCGNSYSTQALAAVAEFELRMKLKRCQNRNLSRKDTIVNGLGNFEPATSDRLAAKTKLKAPLRPTQPKASAQAATSCHKVDENPPYNKSIAPMFLECGDARKFFVNGHTKHIPFMDAHFGHPNKIVTHGALCQYLEQRRRRGYEKWCDPECVAKCSLPFAAYDDRSCPAQIDYSVYDSVNGMLPDYAGHVPGYRYACGMRYSKIASNAKNWLEYNKKDNSDKLAPRPRRF